MLDEREVVKEEDEKDNSGRDIKESIRSIPRNSLITRVEMAHNLAGDMCKFTVLEHLDPGCPKTTDLDSIIVKEKDEILTSENERTNEKSITETTTKTCSEIITKTRVSRCGSSSQPQESCDAGESKTWCGDDKDDIITVKYLPLKLSHDGSSTSSSSDKDSRYSKSTTTQPGEEARGQKSEQARVRLVEHIRKNLTLFETNREIYEACSDYENRGHLQSLLVQKQPPRAYTNQRNVNDQYTQYRASDLVTIHRPSIEEHRGSQSNKCRTNDKSCLNTAKLHQPPKQVLSGGQDSGKATKQVGKGATLKRSVSSLNEFLKRPLDLLNRNKEPQDLVEDSAEKLNSEEYKVPIKQNYISSQNLYLIPAPDYTVHIATLAVRDISVAYQRAIQKANLQPHSNQTKLAQLFGNYSFRTHRSKTLPKNFSTKSGRHSRQHRDYRSQTIDQSVNKIKAKVKMPSGKTDKASIIDNKDGTVKLTYEPKETGQHEISLRYNDEPIDQGPIVFYVDAVGSAKKKITAYGVGLSHGLVGEPCKFTINTGGLGSAKLGVVVEGPSKAQVSLNDNKDGTITVSYLPLVPGEYKVKISFDGKQVVGSPFSTQIGDEGRQRSQISVGKGSEHTLDLKISEEDLKTLNAVIVTPCGLEEPCSLKLLKNGQLAIIFTPREQGDHSVNVKRRGNHISGSPFRFDVLSRDIGDAKQVRVAGKNLKEGKTNTDNEITINTKEAGFGGLSVALEGPSHAELSTKEAADGLIKLNYKPPEPGHYSLTLKYADHVVPGSPFNIKVTGQGTNPQKEYLKRYRKAADIADINTECQFSFKQPGVSAYDLSGKIHSPHGNSEDVSIKDLGDFVYQMSFVPKEVGLYSLSIRIKDIHAAGSPFPFTVGPLLDFGSHKVRCGGLGLVKGACGKLNEFNIFTREAGAGQLHVIVEGPSKAEMNYTDRKDGSCHIGYKVSEPGEYRVSVFFNEQEVPDSPFKAHIMPLSGDVAKIELGPMPPESMIQLDKPCNMTVIMNGAKGNIEGKVILPNGKVEDCFASPIDAENWGVRFIPRGLGIHQVHIKYNKGSAHIPQSPIFIRVGHDNADPASVLVHGHGLKEAVVNHATDFTIETCNAGHALLEVNIEGPSKVSMGCAEIDEGYKVDYTPLAPGDYIISIKYNGCHIGSSPFKVRAIKQPGSRTVADTGSHEVASIAITTTDREAKQKVENMPRFKSDATRVYCKGMGLKKAFAGKPNTLTVNCSEAGFNMIYASFLGPTRNTIHECSTKHIGGSIYEVRYVCKDRGDAILVVKYGDEQIPGSPFKLECV